MGGHSVSSPCPQNYLRPLTVLARLLCPMTFAAPANPMAESIISSATCCDHHCAPVHLFFFSFLRRDLIEPGCPQSQPVTEPLILAPHAVLGLQACSTCQAAPAGLLQCWGTVTSSASSLPAEPHPSPSSFSRPRSSLYL